MGAIFGAARWNIALELAPEDLRDVNEIRSMRGVMETIPTLFSESLSHTESVMQSFGKNDHMLAARFTLKTAARLLVWVAFMSPRSTG